MPPRTINRSRRGTRGFQTGKTNMSDEKTEYFLVSI